MANQKKPEKNKYQKFEIVSINRKDIKGAPYNPRFISEEAKKSLKKIIKDIGLIEPIVVNKQSMNIVGGHSRIDILDSLHKTQDYILDVAMIDVDEKTEKKANIILNNYSIQGEYDKEKLRDLYYEEGFSIGDLGFTVNDLNVLELSNEDFFEVEDSEETIDDLQNILEARKKKKEIKETMESKRDVEFYTVIVFEDMEHRKQWMEKHGFDNMAKYISAKAIDNLIDKS